MSNFDLDCSGSVSRNFETLVRIVERRNGYFTAFLLSVGLSRSCVDGALFQNCHRRTRLNVTAIDIFWKLFVIRVYVIIGRLQGRLDFTICSSQLGRSFSAEFPATAEDDTSGSEIGFRNFSIFGLL